MLVLEFPDLCRGKNILCLCCDLCSKCVKCPVLFRGLLTRMVYLKHDIEGFDLNNILTCYEKHLLTKIMIIPPGEYMYLYYILCLRYTILVENPRIIFLPKCLGNFRHQSTLLTCVRFVILCLCYLR